MTPIEIKVINNIRIELTDILEAKLPYKVNSFSIESKIEILASLESIILQIKEIK